MIKGTMPVTWAESDYTNLNWVTNKIHEEKFNATVNTENYNVGVFMCFENLPSVFYDCLLYTSPSPRDLSTSRMPSSA